MKFVVTVVVAAVLTSVAASNLSRAHAEAFQRKLDQIVLNSETRHGAARQTVVTEAEVNSYLHFSTGDKLPVGVTSPAIAIRPEGRLNGHAIVDLDLVRQKKSSGGWFDPLSYLTGRLPLTATGVLRTHDGRGQFTLESAAVSGVPIPKAVLQEIVSFYTRSDAFPQGIDIDDPFDLPAEIQHIDVRQGVATIVQ